MNNKLIYLLSCATLTLLMFACTKSDEVTPETDLPILFSAGVNAVIETEPRAGEEKETDDDSDAVITLKKLEGKQVSIFGAKYNPPAPNPKPWNLMWNWKANVLNGGALDYASINDQDLKYYEFGNDENNYDFIAVYPAVSTTGETGVTLNNTSGEPSLRINLEYRPDLIVANATGLTKPNAKPHAIPLEFKHQLVQVTFNIYKATNANDENETPQSQKVYLNRMKMFGRTLADFNPVTKAFAFDGNDIIDDGVTVHVSEYLPNSPYTNFLVEEKKKIKDIFLFTANGDIDTKEENGKYRFAIELNEVVYPVTLPAPGDKWEVGKHYNYTFKVVGSDVYLEVGGENDLELMQEKWEDIYHQDKDGEDIIIDGR